MKATPPEGRSAGRPALRVDAAGASRYPRPVPRPLRPLLLSAAFLLLGSACGGGAQHRPSIVGVFPANGSTVEWVEQIRVTYDEPVRVLNSKAARLTDEVTGDGIYVEVFADPSDPRSVFIRPLVTHLGPNHLHHVAIQEGAVVNADDHYVLKEHDSYFTVGSPPNLVVTSSNGAAYELDAATGALLSTTLPPAGYRAREPIGTTGRIWVWLDPVPGPGDSVLGTFVPGDATMTVVPLLGEVGVREGVSFAVSIDGLTLYATAIDQTRNRLRLHRVDVTSLSEYIPPLELSPAIAGSPASFRPAVDLDRNRLYVPFSDGAGGGYVSVVDLATFAELDAGPGPGVDALPTPSGSGPMSYEPLAEYIFLLRAGDANPGFVLIGPSDLAQFPVDEVLIQGSPTSLYVTPDGRYVVQGLDAYDGTAGLVRSEAGDIGEGFAVPVLDDVAGVMQGSDRVPVLVDDPALTRFHAISSDGVESFLEDYEWDDADVAQIDLDPLTEGIQAISLAASVPGVVTGAAYARGASNPP